MPRNPKYLEDLKSCLLALTVVERETGDADAALRAAHELGALTRDLPTEKYNLASALAVCIPIAPAGQRPELADEAVKTLRTAVAVGWRDAIRTARDRELLSLHGRDDFKRLLAELFDRTFPADPFARP